MKHFFIYCLIFSMIGMTSCEDWLDVKPKSEIDAEELFETEAGFKDALTGIYISMTSRDTYGQNLSWGGVEYLAWSYRSLMKSRESYRDFMEYSYDAMYSKDIIDNIWKQQYNTIAQINYLLKSLETNGDMLNPTLYNVVKGEALALRAFLHFDIMRLYGKGNIEKNPSILDERCIPYVLKYGKHITDQKTYRETFELIHNDINEALEYLKSDPLYYNEVKRPADYEEVTNNVFFKGTSTKGRETRMSYPAVKLLEARVWLWEGNKEKANEVAQDLIKGFEKYVTEGDGIHSWATESPDVVASSNSTNKDFVFNGELLFALDVFKLSDYLESYYAELSGGTQNENRMTQSLSNLDYLYDWGWGYGAKFCESDLRWQNWYTGLDYNTQERWVTKIKKTDLSKYSNTLPLMRISEAYLIATEYAIDKGDTAKAIEYLNFLKRKRNISPDFFLASTLDAKALRLEVAKEYWKEFVQEGQLFFYYKRVNEPKMLLHGYNGQLFKSKDMSNKEYQLPYPDIEQDLGQRE